MKDVIDTTSADESARDRRAFSTPELITCPACSRSNAPTRADCLYCGEKLENALHSGDTNISSSGSKVKSEEQFHLVVMNTDVSESVLAELAGIANLTKTEVKGALATPMGALLFATDFAGAENICERLRELGLKAVVIADEKLISTQEPKELRRLDFADSAVQGVVRYSAEPVSAAWEEVMLIVLGRLHFTNIEIEQKKSRGQSRTLDERELSTDEAVLDIHVCNDEAVWRIRSASFDFSCLGERKAVTAFENFTALIEVLRDRAVSAIVDDSYNRLRPMLSKLWPAAEEAGKRERRRTGMRAFEASIASTNNETQFTRYSRLRRFLRMIEREGKL